MERERAIPIRLAGIGYPHGRARIAWLLFALALLLAIGWMASRAPGASIPLLLAATIAYVLAPLVGRLERRGVPRSIVVIVLLISVLAALVSAVVLLGPKVVQGVAQLPGDLSVVWGKLTALLHDKFGLTIESDPRRLFGVSDHALGGVELREMLAGWAKSGASVLGVLIGAITVPMLALFLLYDYERIVRWFRSLIPPRLAPRVNALMREIDAAVGGFLRGQVMVALLLCGIYAVGFSIVGAPSPLVLAVVSGIGNFIPYIGTAFGIALAGLLTMLGGKGLTTFVLILAVYWAAQMLESWVITPRIVGGRVGLPPLAVLLSVLMLGELLGLVGVFIAIPAAAIARILFTVVLRSYRQSDLYRDGAEVGQLCKGAGPIQCMAAAGHTSCTTVSAEARH
jgi:predicted PurR-regulated permease PerM